MIDAGGAHDLRRGRDRDRAAIARHEVHALSVDDGTEATGWPVDVSKRARAACTFDAVSRRTSAARCRW